MALTAAGAPGGLVLLVCPESPAKACTPSLAHTTTILTFQLSQRLRRLLPRRRGPTLLRRLLHNRQHDEHPGVRLHHRKVRPLRYDAQPRGVLHHRQVRV